MTVVERQLAAITSVGSALPQRVVPNSFFEDLVDTSDAWIQERTGIKARRFAGDGETTATLATHAVVPPFTAYTSPKPICRYHDAVNVARTL